MSRPIGRRYEPEACPSDTRVPGLSIRARFCDRGRLHLFVGKSAGVTRAVSDRSTLVGGDEGGRRRDGREGEGMGGSGDVGMGPVPVAEAWLGGALASRCMYTGSDGGPQRRCRSCSRSWLGQDAQAGDVSGYSAPVTDWRSQGLFPGCKVCHQSAYGARSIDLLEVLRVCRGAAESNLITSGPGRADAEGLAELSSAQPGCSGRRRLQIAWSNKA